MGIKVKLSVRLTVKIRLRVSVRFRLTFTQERVTISLHPFVYPCYV
jgi:hypothetical protein